MAAWGLIAGWGGTVTDKAQTGMNSPEVVCHNAFPCWRESMVR